VTGAVAEALGREWVCCEMSEEYLEGARARFQPSPAALLKDRPTSYEIAPTIVGGSKKHGGPDLGPTRARKAWAALGVDGLGIADEAPPRNFVGMPRLTTRMVARLQGFSDSWQFSGKKTPSYRQVGNAFPPPVALAVGKQIAGVLTARRLMRAAG